MKADPVLVQLDGVSYTYPQASAPAVDQVTLEAGAGTVTCLMGVNGCGKSTLIDCILGENSLTSGRILLDGTDISTLRPSALARKVSYVPQVHERAFPYLVRDVVLMGRTPYQGILGSSSDADQEIVDRALRLCRIERLADRPYTQLSGGEMQMVLLARALAQQTSFILMDEPTAHLDFRNELSFMETVVQLVRNQGVGVFIATHSPNQAFFFEWSGVPTVCTLMSAGRVYQTGAPSQVLTSENLHDLYGVHARIVSTPTSTGRPLNQILLISTEECSHDQKR